MGRVIGEKPDLFRNSGLAPEFRTDSAIGTYPGIMSIPEEFEQLSVKKSVVWRVFGT
jgi:hypothetical protein